MRALLLLLAAGMLTACGQAQLKEYSPASAPTPDYSFKTGVRGVLAQYECGATGCHSGATPSGDLNLDPTLTCEQMYQNVMAGGTLQHGGNGKEVDTADPTASLMLTKPTNTSVPAHGGNQRFEVSSPAYDVILTWIQGGALDDCGGS